MPEPTQAERDADEASKYFDRLRANGVDERIAAQLTSAYILGKLRQQEPDSRPEWES